MDMVFVFEKILNMSIVSSYCIGAVILLRFILRRQPKIFSYLLWSVVLFRLLCPVTLSSPYSLLWFDTELFSRERIAEGGKSEAETADWQSADSSTVDMVWETAGISGDTEKDSYGSAMAVPEEDPFMVGRINGLFRAAAWIWLIGTILFTFYGIAAAVRIHFFLKRVSPVPVKECRNVYEAEEIPTPFVFGIVRPKIYISANLSEKARGYVLGHERVHIARLDHLVKIAAWTARCLHWFNPLVWLAFAWMENDMEMSCDEAVIRKFGMDARQEYSCALLSLSCEKAGTVGSPLAFGEGQVKSRILNVLTYRRKTYTAILAAIFLLILAVSGLSLNPMGASGRQEGGEALAFATAYANYFVGRDGNGLVDLYLDEETAFDHVILLEKDNGVYTFGYSSPWPDEFRLTVDEEAQKAVLRYYAWSSDPHVTVWKEEMFFEKTQDGYRVTDSQLRQFDEISTMEEFEEAYWVFDAYQFTDYVERGYVEAINDQTVYDREAKIEQDRNAVYRSPRTAAAWILNLAGGESVVHIDSDGKAVVKYTFADGDSVTIPMYNANYTSETGNTAYQYGQHAEYGDVWIVDLASWSAKAS